MLMETPTPNTGPTIRVIDEPEQGRVVTPEDTKIEEASEEYASASAYMARVEVEKLLAPVAVACRVGRMMYLENKAIRLDIMPYEDNKELNEHRQWFTALGVEKQKRIGKYLFDMARTVDDKITRMF